MAITFTNHLKTNVLDPLQALLVAEFAQSVYYDQEFVERGSNWFNLRVVSDELEEDMASGHTRIYNVLIQYYRMVSGEYKKDTHIDAVSAVTERLKRLIRNNSSHEQYFFNGKLVSINYEPEAETLSPDTVLVEALFSANVFEVV